MPTLSKSVSLALQGGGSHSAFTWGVLDQLLLGGSVKIDAVSATSGGAMMAVVMAQGMLEGGPEKARELMLTFWRKVSVAAGLSSPLKLNIVDKFLSNVGIDLAPHALALDYFTRMLSPYQFNLFDINPLRSIVDEMIDFKALKRSPIRLYINATHAKTGRGRIFSNADLSLEAVMASCCLPFIFKAVDVEGELYWDGGFSGCPPLAPLVEHHASDIVLVQVLPSEAEDVPTAATDILDRATEISFQSVLLHEIESLERRNAQIASGRLSAKPIRLHRLEAGEILNNLGRASKLNADWDFLIHLHDLGVQAATDWLGSSASDDMRESA